MNEKQEIINYKRKQVYKYFDNMTCPFTVLTIPLDITNIANYCKVNRHHYATIAWILVKSANKIYEMRVRCENEKFYLYDKMNIGFTEPLNNHVMGFFECEMKDNLKDFLSEFEMRHKMFLKEQKDITLSSAGVIWCNCEPWFETSALFPPFDASDHTQEFVWDKIKTENGKSTINLTIKFHHGYFDGEHLAAFLDILHDEIQNFNKEF